MADWSDRYTTTVRFMRVSRSTGLETELLDRVFADGSTCTRDEGMETYESASLSASSFDVGTDLVRCYFEPIFADGSEESIAIGTWLPGAPKRDIDGSSETFSVTCYGRLKELADDQFEYPFTISAGTNAVEAAVDICRQSGLEVDAEEGSYAIGAPRTYGLSRSDDDSSVSASSKLDVVNDLLSLASFQPATTDPYGRVVMRPQGGMSPVHGFVEGPSARFLSDMSDEIDWFDVPNVVKVVFSNQDKEFIGIAVNDDPNSELSTVSMGRRICHTERFSDVPDEAEDDEIQALVDARAASLLSELSVATRYVTMSHTYAPVTVGDIVTIDFPTGGVSGDFRISSMRFNLGSGGLLSTTDVRSFR